METTQVLETEKDLGPPPQSIVKRWLLELDLSHKREKDWRRQGKKIWSKYRGEKAKKNSFNILWANTETLRPAIYNSLPKPDVRRRFKDKDPLGKSVSEVLRRSLEFQLDCTPFDAQIINSILDMLLPGRGLARVRYIPSISQVGPVEDKEAHEPAGEALQGDYEEVEWEQAPIEHVQWDDFRCGPGKTWDELPWIAFKHRMTRKELKRFANGADVPLDSSEDTETERDDKIKDLFKTAEVWEIWNKEDSNVLFIAPGLKERPLEVIPDPLNLVGFWPIPKPLYALEDSQSLVPIPLYELYREQAEELDAISGRINVIIKGLKLRGIYDATLTELSELMRGEDNDLIPSEGVQALIDRGGLENAIWFMPIEQAAKVLAVLYEQREQCKAVIYEITGISDILRGSTDSQETATAQQIKSQWGSVRLKRLQTEIQRFIRDLIRLQAEIIAEKFQPKTLAGMTGLQFPTAQEKQQLVLQMQQSGQKQDLPPSWEEITQVLQNDAQRTYKVDIETDSTVAASLEADMQGMNEVLTAIGNTINVMAEPVQSGMMPVEALKEIIMTVCRRSRMGNAVEDALDSMQQPQPQEQDNSLQVEQMKQQADAQKQQADQQHEAQIKALELQHEGQMKDKEMAYTFQVEQLKTTSQAAIEQAKLDFERWKAQLEASTQITIADLSSKTSLEQAKMSGESGMEQTKLKVGAPKEMEEIKGRQKEQESVLSTAMTGLVQKLDETIKSVNAPKTVIRDKSGKITGVRMADVERMM